MTAAAVMLATPLPARAATGDVTEFSAGITQPSGPISVAFGSDGNLWFTEFSGNRIGRMTPAGVVTEFSAGLAPDGQPNVITPGPDGNLWFTDFLGKHIGRITTDGVVTLFSAGINAGASVIGITAGPDGNLWFTESPNSTIGRITPDGVVTEFSAGISDGARLVSITAGPDGNLWFTEQFGNRIGRITPTGVVTEFEAGISPSAGPSGIAAGPDGNLWFTEVTGDRIGRIGVSGLVITEFSAGITAGAMPLNITPGVLGNLGSGAPPGMWFTESGGDRIGHITVEGVVTELAAGIPAASQPNGLTTDSYGNVWFTEFGTGRIARMYSADPAINSVRPVLLSEAVLSPGSGTGPVFADAGTWANDPFAFTLQWQRCADATATVCTDIPGATQNPFRPGPTDAGTRVRAVVVADNGHGLSAPAFSAVSDAIELPTNVAPDASAPAPTPVRVQPHFTG